MPGLDARVILAALGGVFLALTAWRLWRERTLGPQGRAWLIVALVFWLVAWVLGTLHSNGRG